MSSFGLKAFLRAIALFVAILLVKLGIDKIIQTPEPYLKVLYSILIIVVVLILLFVPSFMPSFKHNNSDREDVKKNDR